MGHIYLYTYIPKKRRSVAQLSSHFPGNIIMEILQQALPERRESAIKQEAVRVVREVLSSEEGRQALIQMGDHIIRNSNGGVQDMPHWPNNGIVGPFIESLNSSFLNITLDDKGDWRIPGCLYISPEDYDQEDNNSPPVFHRYNMKISRVVCCSVRLLFWCTLKTVY